MNPLVGSLMMVALVLTMGVGAWMDISDLSEPPEKVISTIYAKNVNDSLQLTLKYSNVDLEPSFTTIRLNQAEIVLNETLESGSSLYLPCIREGWNRISVIAGSQMLSEMKVRCYESSMSEGWNSTKDDSESSHSDEHECILLDDAKNLLCWRLEIQQDIYT